MNPAKTIPSKPNGPGLIFPYFMLTITWSVYHINISQQEPHVEEKRTE